MDSKIIDFPGIYKGFCCEGCCGACDTISIGHINDTFHVKTDDPSGPEYVMQRINKNIFKDIPGLIENIHRVTSHIREKMSSMPGADMERGVLRLIPANDGRFYTRDEEGNYWRMYAYIKGSHSYDIVKNTRQAFEGGRAFGRFQASLSDLPGESLNETIPDFHNIEKRLEVFFTVLEKDPLNRAVKAKPEISFIERRTETMKKILMLGRRGEIPLRITHNDTKFNNVLLDENDRALCIIDLDTVMNGYVHYDFGDSIRTTANTGAEDEEDLSKVGMDIDMFEAYARGFLSETGKYLNPIEIGNLAFSAKLMTFTIGLRFFTDYINGDRYFRISHPLHSLQRTRAQFRLLESMESQEEKMCMIIEDVISGN